MSLAALTLVAVLIAVVLRGVFQMQVKLDDISHKLTTGVKAYARREDEIERTLQLLTEQRQTILAGISGQIEKLTGRVEAVLEGRRSGD